jgi:arylsulfatase A-like enzyme
MLFSGFAFGDARNASESPWLEMNRVGVVEMIHTNDLKGTPMPNSFIRLALLFAIAAVPQLATHAVGAPPNVLLIVTDEHNFRTLGCYRELLPRDQAEMWGRGAIVPTPHLDALAREGVICTRAYATAPVCSPCRAAMITGRYPQNTGVPTNDKILDRSVPTLADRLNKAGYRTAFVGKWHLGGEGKPEWQPKVDGGFQFKQFMFNRGHWKKFVLDSGVPAVGATKDGNPNYDVADADEETFSTDWLTNRAIEYITDTKSSKPFFTVISYPDPHGPNTVRAPYDHRFDELPFQPPRTYETGIPSPKWLGGAKKHPVFRGEDMSRYFGMVQCIDDNIGRLIARLKDSGQLENTLVIMTSDHGDLCYEHDRQNKGNPYEGSARVPMILRMPGKIKPAQVYRDPVGTVDLTPTVMGLLRLDADPNDEGRDLSPAIVDVSKSHSQQDNQDPPITFLRNSGMSAAWVAAVDQRYKLILSTSDTPWLFDAHQDPDELLNFYLRPGTEGVAERLGRALRQYSVETKDPWFEHPSIAASLGTVLGTPHSSNKKPGPYQSRWKGSRRWIGPDWWANPLTDWTLREGSVIAAAAADRTLCLLPADLGSEGSRFEISVEIESLGSAAEVKSAAGFRIGRQGGINDYRHALVHATHWIDATIRHDGRLSLGEQTTAAAIALGEGPIRLKLVGKRVGDTFELTLMASQGTSELLIIDTFEAESIAGGVSLLSNGPSKPGGMNVGQRFAFRNFQLDGDLVKRHNDRSFGPILWSQYTLSQDRLRLQTQLAPLGPRQAHKAELWIADAEGAARWDKVATEPMDQLSRTVTFTLDDWPSATDKRYQVRFGWRGEQHVWDGRIRREPEAVETLKLGCFSCDNGYMFPIPEMVRQVKRQDPDIVFFAGDQIYESYGGFGVLRGADTEVAILDYLRKYYQFGWTWRDILRDRPSVILPDDHDVFQGNLWGHGGRELPEQAKQRDWTWGGYVMPGDWVSAVERTNVGHLPDPAVDRTLPIGIKPYFTSMTYGGVGFAILEDRKFKTGPKSLPKADQAEGVGADLLGEQQEAFLSRWAADWEGQQMKCALSQTIFCTAATHSGKSLKRSRGYADSGAWPKAARDRTVRILGDCNALAIHGDQHLGVLLRHGIDDFDDAGYAFMVPGTANGFPRAWWPGVEKELPKPGQTFTGKYHDDAGKPINVVAVGNPEPGSNELKNPLSPTEIGYRKGSGYGIVEFHKSEHTATFSLYRLGDNDEMFEGFPKTLEIGGQP